MIQLHINMLPQVKRDLRMQLDGKRMLVLYVENFDERMHEALSGPTAQLLGDLCVQQDLPSAYPKQPISLVPIGQIISKQTSTMQRMRQKKMSFQSSRRELLTLLGILCAYNLQQNL
jgi:hypothetical protein